VRMHPLQAFVKLARPRFLMGGVVLHSAGSVHSAGGLTALDMRAFVLGQCAITATQLMTHFSNDYFDVEADRLNRASTMWSGGSRVLVDGDLAPSVARNAAAFFGAAAMAFNLLILRAYGEARLPAFAMLITALVLSISYSAPPLRLHPRGFGAFTAAIVVGGLTPLAGFAMQGAGTLSTTILREVSPLVLAQVALILVLDLPDRPSDEAAQKKTLAVRFGEVASSRLAIALVTLTYVVALLFQSRLLLLTLPLGVLLITALAKRMWQQTKDASRLTFLAVGWFAALSIVMLVSGLGHW
jgi:1,4-dihydroxy-2-naphthoate polyprenyltransferase